MLCNKMDTNIFQSSGWKERQKYILKKSTYRHLIALEGLSNKRYNTNLECQNKSRKFPASMDLTL